MGEDKSKTNYPVEVKALKIRWLFQDDTGQSFLNKVLDGEDIEIYDV